MIYHRLICKLPTVRLSYNNDNDDEVRTVQLCNETVYWSSAEGGGAFCRFENDGDYDGPPDGPPATWKVGCAAGHIVYVPDHEGNEREIPFSNSEFLSACAELVEWVEESV